MSPPDVAILVQDNKTRRWEGETALRFAKEDGVVNDPLDSRCGQDRHDPPYLIRHNLEEDGRYEHAVACHPAQRYVVEGLSSKPFMIYKVGKRIAISPVVPAEAKQAFTSTTTPKTASAQTMTFDDQVRIAGIVLTGILVVSFVSFMAYSYYKRRKAAQKSEKMNVPKIPTKKKKS